MLKRNLYLIILFLLVSIAGLYFLSVVNDVPRDSDGIPSPGTPTQAPSSDGEISKKPTQPPATEQPQVSPEKPDDKLPKVTIVIDDLGNSPRVDGSISEISAPLTLAVLPFRPYTSNAVDLFSGNNQVELILHMPMEPIAEKDKEEKMLMADMKDSEINALLNQAFEQMNNSVVGMNNHKGSLFTSDEKKMRVVLNELKERNLYFLDSYTHAQSLGFSLSKEMGVATTRRDIFLDGQNNEEYIRGKLYETISFAEENGYAIAIGHARESTIKVLKEEAPTLTNQVDFVKASELTK